MTNYKRLLLLSGLLIVVSGWYAKPIIWSASESYSMIAESHAEELDQLRGVKTAYENGNYHFPITKYGHLYYDIALTTVYITSWFTDITDQHIIITLRLISLLCGILSVLMLFQLALRFIDSHTAWLATGMFMIIPLSFWNFSFAVYPDTTQLLFILCSLYWCSFIPLRSDSKPFYLAILFSSLAFSVKYSGIFLLPVIFLVQIFHQSTRERIIPYRFNSKKYLRFLRIFLLALGLSGLAMYWFMNSGNISLWFLNGPIESPQNVHLIENLRQSGLIMGVTMLVVVIFQPLWNYLEANTPLAYNIRLFSYKAGSALGIFALVFAVTSPYLIINFEFLRGMLDQPEIVSQSHLHPQNPGLLGWIKTLMANNLLDNITFWTAVLGFILSIIQFFVRGVKARKSVLWISSFWIILYFTMLVFRMVQQAPQLLTPILPFVVLLSAYAILSTYRKLLDFIQPRRRSTFEFVFILLVIGAYFLANFSQFWQYRTDTASRERSNSYLEASRYLKESSHIDNTIIFDPYSYISTQFTPKKRIWNMRDENIAVAFTPGLIVMNDKMRSRFQSDSIAKSFTDRR